MIRSSAAIGVVGLLLACGSLLGAVGAGAAPPGTTGPKPQRICDQPVHGGWYVEVAVIRVECNTGRALVKKLFRANPNLPGPGLPGWNCHGAKGPTFQGHCHDKSAPKGKRRIIEWWPNE
jgi:hypothetical protein